ncbi:MAG: hypothetical protein CML24_02080 [Rhizobiales bacterium]|nr:hypothetical protein [Hyphomicrobiales bacterium]|tara:strand:- start:3220 stop:3558 length:339 start_codon:yes stop_codon:yes gene_type:complete
MRDPDLMGWIAVLGTFAAIGAVAWLQRFFQQAEYRRLVKHFISLDRIAELAGIERKNIWLGPIRRRGVVEYSIDLKTNLDGSEDYRAIEKSVADHHRESLEYKRRREQEKTA